jgi:hypothetical protein
MRSRSTAKRLGALLTAGFMASLMLGQAAPLVQGAQPNDAKDDTKELRKDMRGADAKVNRNAAALKQQPVENLNRPAKVGDIRTWLAYDDTSGYYLKDFVLRGANKTAELWTALDLLYPEGDCRNDDPARVLVSDAQVAYLLEQFANTIRPIDTAWFGEPNQRTGTNGALPGLLGISDRAYKNNQGRDVILVDNVRDTNFYDTDNANSLPRIGGFYTGAMAFYHDRNVITVDSYDWIARTGADPVHNPSTDPCINSPARPFLFEGTIAHEYQHLIHADYDSDELNWVNEGMSDFAEVLTGYSDPALHVDEEGWDTHIQGFLGWLSVAHPEWNPIPAATGPENSLTLWEDQPNPAEIFEDYGFAYYFMTFLNSLGYGQDFFTAWQHNPENGIAGLDSTLSAAGSSDTFRSLFTDVAVSALVDGFIDNGGAVTGADAAALQNGAAEATVFFSPDAYSTPGAPPWGSDYVPLGSGASLTSVSFDGDEEFVFPGGPEWVVDADGYWTNPDAPDSTNYDSNQDLDITREVNVTGAGLLEFDHYYQTELGWDFGFVQTSTDGGATFTSVACTGTTSDHNASADPAIASQVPGFTGPDESGEGTVGTATEPVHVSCDLPDAVGSILLSFRLMTDAGVNFDGWHLKNVTLDGAAVDDTPADLSDWNNQTFYSTVALDFILQVVGLTGTVDTYGDITAGGDVVVLRPTLGDGHTYTLSAADLAALAGSTQVVAIVSAVLADETTRVYAPYSLLVNGAERADGAGL